MTSKRDSGTNVTAEDIHAYVDGQLGEDSAAIVRAWLAENPEAAAVAEDYRLINAAIRSRADAAEMTPVPIEQIAAVQARRSLLPAVAAAAVLLAVGAGAGWFLRGYATPEPSVLDQLAMASGAVWATYAPDARRPVEVAAADDLSHWLTNRVGQDVRVPALDALGLTFVGGRLVTGEAGPAAMLMYQDVAGRRLIVYVSPELAGDGPTGMHFRPRPEAGAVIWANGKTGFGVAGPFTEGELTEAAMSVRDSFAT